MQFSAKKLQNNPNLEIGTPPGENLDPPLAWILSWHPHHQLKCWVLSQFQLWDSNLGPPIPKQRRYHYAKGSDPKVRKNHLRHYRFMKYPTHRSRYSTPPRIQDFPDAGGGANLLFSLNFPENCMRGSGDTSKIFLCRSTTELRVHFKELSRSI